MGVAEKQPEPVTYEQAIHTGIDWCLHSSRPPSEVITDATLDMLTPEAFREFARRGWVSELNNTLHHERTPPAESVNARPGGHPMAGRNPNGAWSPLDIRMVGADGSLKRLAIFDIEDIEYLYVEAEAQEQGWARRRRWAESARKMLAAHKRAKRIEQLPRAQVAELGELARESWS